MSKFRELFVANRQTFYHFDQDGHKVPDDVWYRYLVMLLLAFVAALFADAQQDDFLGSVIAIISIIIGFAFSVLVFFATQDPLKIVSDVSREKRNQKSRANELGDEIFVNIGYFVYISLGFLVAACVWFFVANEKSVILTLVELFEFQEDKDVTKFSMAANFWVFKLVQFAVFALFFESIATFFRVVRRVMFYFSERRLLM